ncbi:MAG: ATP-binding cassette domain-containing protein [Eubacteriales bacterium]|nr:ATP-binding cassette domain-containing protein [Eubacteriales bacterium]
MKLEIRNLKKTYGTVQALKGISYTFEPGIYGILGANGAGKSTMINLITDNVARDAKGAGGNITYQDDDITGDSAQDILKLGSRFRALVGYMPQQQGFYEDFSPKAFLKYMAEIKGVKAVKLPDGTKRKVCQQIDELLEVVNLTSVAYKKIGGFSGGMKQRVLLAQALLGNPKILILDEPTAGLDPKERIGIRNYIAELSRNKIILFATHVVSDIECIADHVLLLKKGEIIADGTPVELIEQMRGKVGELTCTLDDVGKLQEKYRVGNIKQRKDGLALRLVGDELPEDAVRVDSNIDLEDVYLYHFE